MVKITASLYGKSVRRQELITPQDTRVLVTQDGFKALIVSAKKKRAGVNEQQCKKEVRTRQSSATDQVNADTEYVNSRITSAEADQLESVLREVVVVIPGKDQDRVTKGSFVTLCIECDGDKPDRYVTPLLYQSPVEPTESHIGVMSLSSDVGKAVLGQSVGRELLVWTRRNGQRTVKIIRSQRLREVPKPKVKP